jgi:hypothetical protein
MKPTPLHRMNPARRIMRPPAPRHLRRWADLGYVLIGAVCVVVLGIMLGMASTGN